MKLIPQEILEEPPLYTLPRYCGNASRWKRLFQMEARGGGGLHSFRAWLILSPYHFPFKLDFQSAPLTRVKGKSVK